MSILRSVGSAVATAIKSVAKAVGRAVISGVKSIPGAIRGVGRAGLGAVRLAGRVVSATARVGYRAALVGTGLAANAVNNLVGMFGRGGGTELPEPDHGEVFSPTDAWLEEMESAHEAHEIGEVETSFADNPDAQAYVYAVSDDKTRRTMDMSKMSPEVRSWCHSLCESERVLVKRAGCEKMLRHLEGRKMIQGVRKVKPREVILDFTQRNNSAYAMNHDADLEPGMAMRMA
jgi:hypothetical protein